MSKESKPERPKITEVHQTFYKKVILLAQKITDVAVRRTIENVSIPPPPNVLERLHRSQALITNFQGKDMPRLHSRAFEGDLTGSDFFTFRGIDLPSEAYHEDAPAMFPARIIEMTFLYGNPNPELAQCWGTRLYTGHGVPPIFVDKELSSQLLVTKGRSISDLAALQDKLPESAFHYPNSKELELVLGGLAVVHEDVEPASLEDAEYYFRKGVEHDPSFREALDWINSQK